VVSGPLRLAFERMRGWVLNGGGCFVFEPLSDGAMVVMGINNKRSNKEGTPFSLLTVYSVDGN